MAQNGAADAVVDLAARLVTSGDAPGYRDAQFVFDLKPLGNAPDSAIRARIYVRPEDGEAVVRHVTEVHRHAWDGHEPLDVRPGERRPTWIDQAR
jgi:hypothetical protein